MADADQPWPRWPSLMIVLSAGFASMVKLIFTGRWTLCHAGKRHFTHDEQPLPAWHSAIESPRAAFTTVVKAIRTRSSRFATVEQLADDHNSADCPHGGPAWQPTIVVLPGVKLLFVACLRRLIRLKTLFDEWQASFGANPGAGLSHGIGCGSRISRGFCFIR